MLGCFRPQQGLTIMNCDSFESVYIVTQKECFRPQQGLTIMNSPYYIRFTNAQRMFPSPTGVNYYE